MKTLSSNLKSGIAFLFLLACSALVTSRAYAANHYVDKDAPGGDGTTWEKAYKTFAAIKWNLVKPGDFINISGGATSKTYNETITVQASGLQGQPITIRPGQDNQHNGIVIFDFTSASAQGRATQTAIDATGRNYITISGNYNGQNHLKIQNLYNYFDRYSATGVYAFGESTSARIKGIILEYIDMYNINNGARLAYLDDSEAHHLNLIGIRGDTAIEMVGLNSAASWDNNKVYNNNIELWINTTTPPGATGPYSGPDGIQAQNGTSIFNNITRATYSSNYTSDQHPDMIQATGRYIKIYGNEFINVADSQINYGTSSANTLFSDVIIYNNIFRIEQTMDTLPEFIRMYASASYGGGTAGVSAINNIKILNNLFIDNNKVSGCASSTPGWSYCPVQIVDYGSTPNPTAVGNEIRNNIFVNVGQGSNGPAINIGASSNFTANSFLFSNNIYYSPSNDVHIKYNGAAKLASTWISSNEAGSGKTAMPQFKKYTAFANNNDYHLTATDTVAKNSGISLSYFSSDKDGIGRPQGSAWDIGPYEVGASSSTPQAPSGLRVN